MRHLAGVDNLRRDKFHPVRWDGKTHATGRSVEFRVNRRQGWNTYQVALHVYQRPTTIARIDGSIGLNSIGDNSPVLFVHIATKGADNPIRHRLSNTQRVTNGQYILSYDQA